LAGKESVQNVHWKILALRDLACCATVRCVIGALLRLRRSCDEANDPLDRFDLEDAKVRSLLVESLVPKLLTDGARNIEKEESSSLEAFRELVLDPAREPCALE
jgi:hypothetical protein